MRLWAALLTSALAVTSATTGCSSASDGVTTPSATIPDDQAVSPPSSDRSPVPALPSLPPDSGTCDSDRAAFAVGERASDALLERARVAAGASIARFIRPNQPITTEYLASRLNLNLDARDVLRSVGCG